MNKETVMTENHLYQPSAGLAALALRLVLPSLLGAAGALFATFSPVLSAAFCAGTIG